MQVQVGPHVVAEVVGAQGAGRRGVCVRVGADAQAVWLVRQVVGQADAELSAQNRGGRGEGKREPAGAEGWRSLLA